MSSQQLTKTRFGPPVNDETPNKVRAASESTMFKLCLVLSALVVFMVPITTAAQVDFSSIDVFLKAILKNEDELRLEARGDLNGDGLVDWVGVIRRPKSHFTRTYQLYVLLRQRPGGFSVAEKTDSQEMGGMGSVGLEDIKIRRSSIYLYTYAKSVKDLEDVTHQFKLYNGELRLVGIRIHYWDNTPGARATAETQMNFLTGMVIEKRRKGKNKPITKRQNKKFATYLLKDFTFLSNFGRE